MISIFTDHGMNARERCRYERSMKAAKTDNKRGSGWAPEEDTYEYSDGA
jgi:hypothetical protein